METIQTEVVVIGAGPGGYVAGIRLAQLGKKVVVVERDQPGGVCLNVGCIPSKALITAAKTYDRIRHAEALGIVVDGARLDMPRLQAWKGEVVNRLTSGIRQLLKASGAQLLAGDAVLASPTAVDVQCREGLQRLEAEAIVVATGSRPISIPGFAIDNQRILDSTGALALGSVPERLLVVGGGYIGVELGTLYAKLGAKVTIVEFTSSLLPGSDPEMVQVVARKLKKLGVTVLLETRADSWHEDAGALRVVVAGKGGEQEIHTDKILVTVGRRPNSDNIGLDRIGVAIDHHGFVHVDGHQRTTLPTVYAIGDVCGQPMLAHKASKEAEVVAEVLAGRPAEMDTDIIPAVVFSDPEIASVGLTAAEAERRGIDVRVGKFPFAALGRAMTQQETDGFVKTVSDAGTGALLGVHVVGPSASDLISEGALALEMGAAVGDLALTIHPHPTLGEALMEAAKAALGESPHLVGGGQKEKR